MTLPEQGRAQDWHGRRDRRARPGVMALASAVALDWAMASASVMGLASAMGLALAMISVVIAASGPALAAPHPQAGSFLVADESLRDPNFRRSVVLIIHHDANGSIGLIVNQHAHFVPEKLLPGVNGLDRYRGTMFVGGPVGLTQVSVLSTSDDAGERLIDGVYLSNDPESLARLVEQGYRDESSLRIFLGYAGWSPGQLDREIESGAWRLREATAQDVFEDPERLWPALSRPRPQDDLLRVDLGKPLPACDEAGTGPARPLARAIWLEVSCPAAQRWRGTAAGVGGGPKEEAAVAMLGATR